MLRQHPTPATAPDIRAYFDARMKDLNATESDYQIRIADENGVRRSVSLFAPGRLGIDIFYPSLTGELQQIDKKDKTARYVVTRLHPELVQGSLKYRNPYGQAARPWIPSQLIEAYRDRTRVKTLYLIEGQFKAFAAARKGLPIIAIPGIQSFRDTSAKTEDRKEYFNSDIQEIIRACKVDRVVMLHDADALQLGSEGDKDKDRSERLKNFASSLVNFLKSCELSGVSASYAHVKPELQDRAKGLDDLLAAFPDNRTNILSELQSLEFSEYFSGFDIEKTGQIWKYFGLTSVDEFYKRYGADLGESFLFRGERFTKEGAKPAATLQPRCPVLLSKPGAAWISDYIPELLSEIMATKKAVATAGTKAGKTTAILKAGGLADQLHQSTGKMVVFVVPVNLIGKQSSFDFELDFVKGGTRSEAIGKAIERGVCITNAASLKRLCAIFRPEEINLIVDESQDIFDAAYKDSGGQNQMQFLYRLMKDVEICLAISATPYPFLESVGFKYLKFDIPKSQRVELEVKEFSGMVLPTLIDELKAKDYTKGAYVLRLNSHNSAEIISDQITPLLPAGKRVCIINADNKEHEDTKEIEERKQLPADAALAIFTSVIDVGVNIETTNIEQAIFAQSVGYARPETIAQFFGRFRKMEVVPGAVFLRSKRGGFAPNWSRRFISEVVAWRGELEAVEQYHHAKDQEGQNLPSFRDSDNAGKFLIFNEESGKYEVDELRLAREIINDRDKALTVKGIVNALHEFIPNLTTTDPKKVDSVSDTSAIDEARHESKIVEAAGDARIFELIEANPEVFTASASQVESDSIKHAARRLLEKSASAPSEPDESIVSELNEIRASWRPFYSFADLVRRGHSVRAALRFLRAVGEQWRENKHDIIERQEMQVARNQAAGKDAATALDRIRKNTEILDATQGKTYFDGDTLTNCSSEVATVRLFILSKNKQTREAMSKRDQWTAEGYKTFATAIKKNEGRANSRDTIAAAYVKAFPAFEKNKKKAAERGVSLLKKLFETEIVREGKTRKYRALEFKFCAQNHAQILLKNALEISDILPAKRRLVAGNEVFNNSVF